MDGQERLCLIQAKRSFNALCLCEIFWDGLFPSGREGEAVKKTGKQGRDAGLIITEEEVCGGKAPFNV